MFDDDVARDVLTRAHTIAVVGMSPNPGRASYQIAKYLEGAGYEVYYVNPVVPEIEGKTTYPDVASLPVVPDIVDVFRKAEDIPGIMQQSIQAKVPCVWVQLGIVNEDAAAAGRDAGLTVVMDRCILVEHRRLLG
jgi:predicted CoA-binding protein